ncbi:amino acid permease [Leekyejoonella antrihumi]|uniref:Amino acid permease n=1 Tax=Leekyejoonella antrihumi TaxID=1660198 RepID=A0A563DYC0_9MICO|nr:amino acid permease [Leekyejoonella antrihumi]TWP34971.1 amino acid permease [Leekyejoonella antrihumi]
MTEVADETEAAGLSKGLKQRHMTMIAIGGTIGAGLFVGSGTIIHAAGPASLVSFLIAGILITLVMRMLGEMAVARPTIGSFYEYAREGLGNWAGFSIGWLYWYYWVIVVAIEAVAGAAVLGKWLPSAPVWLTSLVLLALMTATNLISVAAFGEFEYWFSSIKVAAIIVFLLLGILWITGALPNSHAGVANLTQMGGFVPHGWGEVISKAVPAVGFFVGVELVTLAAAESAEPGRMVARATNAVVARVLLFYVGSMFVIVAVMPWNSQNVLGSPFVTVLDKIGIPGAGDLMNAIILTAVLSSLNSGLYATSRMLFALTQRGHAPKALVKTNSRGVPARAILIGTVVALISIGVSYVSPDKVFAFLISSYGALALFVYLLIALAQVRIRFRMQRENPEALTFKMWLFPWLSYLTIAGMAAVILAMFVSPDTRTQAALSTLSFAVLLLAYAVMVTVRKRRGLPVDPSVESASTESVEEP